MINKRYLRFSLQVFFAIIIIYALITTVQHFSCSCDKKEEKGRTTEIDDLDSIPAVLKLGKADPEGNVQILASFESRDLARLWKRRGVGGDESIGGKKLSTGEIPVVRIVRHNEAICKNNKHFKWILYVVSSAGNNKRRDLIRSTWGSPVLFANNLTRIIFLVGTPSDEAIKKQLDEEYNIHKDIVQGDFEEKDKSDTKKSVLGLKWISEHCQEAEFALKANDNAFINIFGMISMMETVFGNNRTILCPLWGENTMPILRDPQKCGGYCVKEEDFPGQKFFPQYCAGVGYCFSASLAKELYEVSQKTESFWIEDVYTTGVLVPKLKEPVDYINCHSSFNSNVDVLKEQYLENKEIEVFIGQVGDEELFKKMWKSLINKLPPNWFSKLSDETIVKNA